MVCLFLHRYVLNKHWPQLRHGWSFTSWMCGRTIYCPSLNNLEKSSSKLSTVASRNHNTPRQLAGFIVIETESAVVLCSHHTNVTLQLLMTQLEWFAHFPKILWPLINKLCQLLCHFLQYVDAVSLAWAADTMTTTKPQPSWEKDTPNSKLCWRRQENVP